MLTHGRILECIQEGTITIEPFIMKNLNPNSYNVTMGDTIKVYNMFSLDAAKQNTTKTVKIPKTGYKLHPNVIYLIGTAEIVGSSKYVPMMMGRSSYGRLGMSVMSDAGLGDVGYVGHWTMMVTVVQPLTIYPNTNIGQIYFLPVEGDVDELYTSKYQNSVGAQESKSYLDFKNTKVTTTEQRDGEQITLDLSSKA